MSNDNMMVGGYENRKNWIDLAKAIGIILVVLAHSLPKNTFVWKYIQQFHMPLFYIISGYLYSCKGTWMQYIKKKLKTLWMPFMGCGIITIILKIIISFIANHSLGITVKYIIKFVFMQELAPLQGATWFLSVLLYALVAFDLLMRGIHRLIKQYEMIGIFVISIILFVIGSNISLPYYTSHILVALSYIGIGYWLKKYEMYAEKISILACIVAFVLIAGATQINDVSVALNSYTYKSIFFLTGIVGSVTILAFCKKYENRINNQYIKKQCKFLGRNTIGILIWQFVSFKLVMIIQILVYKMPWRKLNDFPIIYECSNIYWTILYTIVGIYLSIFIYKILSQFAKVITKQKQYDN